MKRIMNNHYKLGFALVALTLASCTPEANDSLFENKYTDSFKQMIGGEIDKNQTWVTGTVIVADVRTSGPATVSAYTLGKQDRVLYARKQLNGAGSMEFAIPQNLDKTIAFEADYGDAEKVYRKMDLSLALTQRTTVDLTRSASTRALAESNSVTSPAASLCGSSNASTDNGYAGHHFGYTAFPR